MKTSTKLLQALRAKGYRLVKRQLVSKRASKYARQCFVVQPIASQLQNG